MTTPFFLKHKHIQRKKREKEMGRSRQLFPCEMKKGVKKVSRISLTRCLELSKIAKLSKKSKWDFFSWYGCRVFLPFFAEYKESYSAFHCFSSLVRFLLNWFIVATLSVSHCRLFLFDKKHIKVNIN